MGAGFCSEPPLCFVAVPFAFAVLLECVCDCDYFVHEVIAVHDLDGLVGCFEAVVRHKAITLGEVALVSCDLRRV